MDLHHLHHHHSPLPPISMAALHEAAKAEARRLRAEAMNQFWSAIGRGLRAVLRRPRRDLAPQGAMPCPR